MHRFQGIVAALEPFLDSVDFTVALGNEPLAPWYSGQHTAEIVPAITSLRQAILAARHMAKIRVTVPFWFGVIETSYPPKDGAFGAAYAPTVLAAARLLRDDRSFFCINVYSFFAHRSRCRRSCCTCEEEQRCGSLRTLSESTSPGSGVGVPAVNAFEEPPHPHPRPTHIQEENFGQGRFCGKLLSYKGGGAVSPARKFKDGASRYVPSVPCNAAHEVPQIACGPSVAGVDVVLF